MGEFDFIEAVRRSFEGVGDGSIVGIGDDCAVFPPAAEGGEATVATTDMLVEGVHFLRGATSARELGAKSLAVNLSDVAAMGAHPLASLLSIALPTGCRGEWAREFMEGYREMSARHGVRLAGGDTTGSMGGVAINVVAIGRAPLSKLKYRSGARVGDAVAVCGPLGGSAAGLADILGGHLDSPFAHVHRNPAPQVEEGEWLGSREEVHAMIDLSDGLASDLAHILRASSVGAEIELGAIPAAMVAGRDGADAHFATTEQAVAGGEDYKLLFTAAPAALERLAADYRARFGEEFHVVGRIVAGEPEIVWKEDGRPVKRKWSGFVHF